MDWQERENKGKREEKGRDGNGLQPSTRKSSDVVDRSLAAQQTLVVRARTFIGSQPTIERSKFACLYFE